MITALYIFSGDLWAGAEVMIFNLLTSLKEGREFGIIALSLNKGTLTDKLGAYGIETHIIPESTHSLAGIYTGALRLFKKRKIDIIHSHRYKEDMLAVLLAKSLGIKKLYSTIHGLPEAQFRDRQQGRPVRLQTRMHYYLINSFFTRAVAVSHEMKDFLIRQRFIDESKLEVIYNGIPVPPADSFSCTSPNGKVFHIGTVGRMAPVKDYNLFLETAAEIKKRTGRVRFSILGDGPLRGQLMLRAKELKIENDVEFLSPRSDPFPYYKALDLYLNTSYHEGMPLSILEAMAYGKIVVAPSVGGIAEIIISGRDGFLFDSREPGTIADLCVDLMDPKGPAAVVCRNAAERVSSCFSSSKMAASYLDLYRSGSPKIKVLPCSDRSIQNDGPEH